MHLIALLPWFKRIVDTFYSISFIANTFQRNTVIDCELEKNNYIIELFKKLMMKRINYYWCHKKGRNKKLDKWYHINCQIPFMIEYMGVWDKLCVIPSNQFLVSSLFASGIKPFIYIYITCLWSLIFLKR